MTWLLEEIRVLDAFSMHLLEIQVETSNVHT